MQPHFKTTYWGDDQSTEVVFEAIKEPPSKKLVSACMVFAIYENENIVMSKPKRGWGLLGGHREGDETAEECVRREAYEEASAVLSDVKLIGRWATRKRFYSPHNEKYPDFAYQLLYVANVEELDHFVPQFEITDRAIVPFSDIKDYHHDFVTFADVLDYTLSTIKSSNRVV